MDDTSWGRCQRINDLTYDDRSFLRLSTLKLLTQVGLIPARVAVELVDALLEAGMALRSAISLSFL